MQRLTVESFNRRLGTESLNRNHWTSLFAVRVAIGDFKADHNQRHRHSALGYPTPSRVRCGLHPRPPPGALQD
ncbi:integrase core domain-containing protein [Nocardia beijingensis]|uniref:Integrase core domain-containing protein n=1 Tax=Nocardia beijingensis TaxID=95162 RepID=A0ABW7WSL7_9NOCA